MHLYLFLLTLGNFIVSCYGAASSSAQPTICLVDNPVPNGLYFYESCQRVNGLYETNFVSKTQINDPFNKDNRNGRGFHVANSFISEQALQNNRRRQGFPTEFTMRYRRQDGTWHCGDHYVMPDQFWYRDPDHDQLTRLQGGYNYRYPESTKNLLKIPSPQGVAIAIRRNFPDVKKGLEKNIQMNAVIHNAPLKKFPEDNCQPTITALQQDITIYIEMNRFDGPLLPTVGDYFRCFPKLCYLSLKHYMKPKDYLNQDSYMSVLDSGLTFLRMQEQRDSAEQFNLSGSPYDYYSANKMFINSQAQLSGITWEAMPVLPLGTIPPWPAQSIYTKESLTLRACLNPTLPPAEPRGRIIDLRNHAIDINELKNVTGEGNIFVLSAEKIEGAPFSDYSGITQLSHNQVAEINNHFAQRCPWYRRCFDTLYAYRYHLAAGAAATVTAAYIYNNHSDLVLKRAREIAPIAEKLAMQRNVYRALKNLIATAKDKQTVAQMTADEMRTIFNAQVDIATVRKELYRLHDIMPYSWTLLHSLIAAIKNCIDKITGIMIGTYVADVGTKYFLGYRPYQPSRIHVQNNFHDYFYDKIPYKEVEIEPADSGRYTERGYCCHSCDIATFYEHKPRNFDALLPHYDEATEERFKRNQSLATLGTFVGIPFAAILWYAMRQAK